MMTLERGESGALRGGWYIVATQAGFSQGEIIVDGIESQDLADATAKRLTDECPLDPLGKSLGRDYKSHTFKVHYEPDLEYFISSALRDMERAWMYQHMSLWRLVRPELVEEAVAECQAYLDQCRVEIMAYLKGEDNESLGS